MHYHQSHTHPGAAHGKRGHHPFFQAMHRAPVNIYKTENSYEMLVFAPGRVKENFTVSLKDKQLNISYQPSQETQRPDWTLREYSRGGFERIFSLDANVEATAIKATYSDGVLQVSLPLIAGKEGPDHEIPVN